MHCRFNWFIFWYAFGVCSTRMNQHIQHLLFPSKCIFTGGAAGVAWHWMITHLYYFWTYKWVIACFYHLCCCLYWVIACFCVKWRNRSNLSWGNNFLSCKGNYRSPKCCYIFTSEFIPILTGLVECIPKKSDIKCFIQNELTFLVL